MPENLDELIKKALKQKESIPIPPEKRLRFRIWRIIQRYKR